MYLKDCFIENIGPIKSIDLSLPFQPNGIPQPIVLVGGNGSGKSILLSYVVDALTELAKQAFSDIVARQGQQPQGGSALGGSPYFRWIAPTNQRSNTPFGIALLEFFDGDRRFSYVDKTGTLNPSDLVEGRAGRFEFVSGWPVDGNHKKAGPEEKEIFQHTFEKSAVCYFPASRKEYPHWLNRVSVSEVESPAFEFKIQGALQKPIYVESSAEQNKKWLLDVIIDSRLDFIVLDDNRLLAIGNTTERQLLRRALVNVENVLKQILSDNSAQLILRYRNDPAARLAISTENGTLIIPSLDNLSSGQSILFNLFATIVRYADKGDINKSLRLNEIEGMVLIDEIDAHLHADLQYNVLPKLLKLFPLVQFIVTTHAPLFLLGMREEFGEGNFQIIEMPDGVPISAERFTEFKKSFDFYKATKEFEEELENRIVEGTKPLILTEGETDPKFITTALTVLGRVDLLGSIEIDWVGRKVNGQSIGGGYKSLDNLFAALEANPSFVKRKVLLLYDCDTNKPTTDSGLISIRQIPQNPANTKLTDGIENLFPEKLFKREFYPIREEKGKFGAVNTIQHFQKVEFCNEICKSARKKDFAGFSVVIEIIENWLTSAPPREP